MVEVAMHAGHKVLVKVDISVLIVGDPQGIWGQQLRPCQIHYLNIIFLHKCSEQIEHSQIKGIKHGIKNFAHPYMVRRARVYLWCLSVCRGELEFNTFCTKWTPQN